MAWTLVDHVEAGFADGNSGHALALPGGGTASAGDIDAIIIGSDTTVSTPSGFTLPANGSHVGNQGGYAFYRICTGGESATVTITTAGNFDTSAGFSRWSGGVSFDLAGNANVDNSGNTANPALSTGTLGGADELIVAGSVMTDASGSNATTPVWGNSFTAIGSSASSGTGSSASVGFFAYKTGVGTTSESVSVTWTNQMRNRYAFFLAFKRSDPIASDSSGSTAMTAAATSASVNITAAATGAWCYCWVALGVNSGTVSATGWTSLLNSDEGTSAHYALLRRQKQSGDTTFTFSWTNSTKGTLAWKSYLGLDGTTPDEQATLATNGSTSRTAVPTSSATPTGLDRWAVACFGVRTTNVANKPITWTPDAATTERVDVDNNAAGSSPWCGVEIADTAAIVSQASHSYTASHNVAESHDGSAIFFLVPSSGGTTFTANLTGALSSTGALTRTAAKPTAGALSPAGTATKVAGKALTGGITPAGGVTKVAAKVLAGVFALAGGLAKAVARQLAGTLVTSGALTSNVTAATVPAASTAAVTAGRVATGTVTGPAATAAVTANRVSTPEVA